MQNAHTYRQDHSLAQSQFIFSVFFYYSHRITCKQNLTSLERRAPVWTAQFLEMLSLCTLTGIVQSVQQLVHRATRNQCSIPGRGKQFFFSLQRSDRLWGQPCILSNGYRCSLFGIKRPGRDVDRCPPSSAKVNAWSYTSTPPHVLICHGA
jgi:hypothetical protein